MNDSQMTKLIRQEKTEYEKQEVIHNSELNKQIIQTWKQNSPKMVERLNKLHILNDLAFVVQERMWRTSQQYRKAGMPVTDAREQAEKEHLMLDEEALTLN